MHSAVSAVHTDALISLDYHTQVVQANLGKYLGEAAASIFSPTSNDTVPWGGSPFTGGAQMPGAAMFTCLDVCVLLALINRCAPPPPPTPTQWTLPSKLIQNGAQQP